MKGLAIGVLALSFIVMAGAACALFMIFSPSVTVVPTTILTGAVEGLVLLALSNVGLAAVVLARCFRRERAEPAVPGVPAAPGEPRA